MRARYLVRLRRGGRRLPRVNLSKASSAFVEVERLTHQPTGSGQPVLRGCDFAAPGHGLILVCGRSGCGKSSLLHVLSGLNEPLSGRVRVGHDARAHTPAHTRSQLCGLVFQFPERHFIGESVREELLAGHPPSTSLQHQAAQAILSTGLSDLDMLTHIDRLSGGFKRRLALAVQLVRSPSLLLLDEPLAGLDFVSRDSIVSLLSNLSRSQPVIVRCASWKSSRSITSSQFFWGVCVILFIRL